MLDRLPESTPVRQRSVFQLAGAVTIHAAVIASAMAVTRELAARPSQPPTPSTMMAYLAPSARPLPNAPRSVGGGADLGGTPAPPAGLTLPPGPVVIAGIPTLAPPAGFDGDPTRGWRPTTPLPLTELPRDEDASRAAMVDEPVVPLRGPEPRYPAALRAAGIEGTVRLRFVVDSTGTVVDASVRAIAATHDAFLAPAVAAVRQWRFRPARLGGQAVAQQVEQVVRFRLDR